MKHKLLLILLVILLLASTTLACSLFTRGSDEVAEEAPAAEQAPEANQAEPAEEAGQAEEAVDAEHEEEAKPEDEAQPADEESSGDLPSEIQPAPGVSLGEEMRSPEGGYAFQPIPEYTTETFFGMSVMEASDADEDFGPYIMMVGSENDEEMTNDEIYDSLNSEMEMETDDSVEIVDEREILVDGHEGILMDFAGMDENKEVRARVVVVAVTPLQQFTMIASSTADRWNEVEPLFDTVLSSVHFFEPEGASFDLFDEDGDDDTEGNDSEAGEGEDFFMISTEDGFPTFVENYTVYDNQSTDDEYIFAFVSEDLHHTLTLYLPMNLDITMLTLQSYDINSSTHAPGATITIGENFYTAQSGMIIFEETTDGYITGSYFLDATNSANSTDIISVTGFFTELTLP